MNIKKLFAVLAGVSFTAQTLLPVGVMGATYSQELQGAYDWAYAKGVTTQSPIDNANMYGAITRAEMAKMLSVYAEKVLGLTADEAASCNFTDIDSVKGDLHDYIIKSCKLGIMGQKISAFRPYDTLSRAEFGTALSRVLWGNKYEGGTPYYANHLNALKAAGIMNQIANAEQTKEVRGYVMLMLQRSEASEGGVDCDDPVITIACLDPELDAYKECPAACREDASDEKDSDEKVKSGDLSVEATANNGGVILANGVSDMDTLTFKSSEEVEITKVVLERYGYSSNDDVADVRLEDEDGVKITADGVHNPDSKGQIKLSIKKANRKVDGTLSATVVIKTKASAGSGNKTIGFKVIDVDSTAKNLDIDGYKAHTYSVVNYDGADVIITARGSSKTYNWEEGKSYEVAKFKLKAPSDSAITVKSFTLTDKKLNAIEFDDFLDGVEVTVAGKKVKSSYKVDGKDNKLTISLDDIELEPKENAEFAVNIELSNGFDNMGKEVQFAIAEPADISATDVKTESRVLIKDSNGNSTNWSLTWPTYKFDGGKVKISSTKLGNVEATEDSTDIVIAEGEITTAQTIKASAGTITVTVNNSNAAGSGVVKAMRLQIAGDEYEGTATKNSNGVVTSFSFPSIDVDHSGKIKLLVDTVDKGTENDYATFSINGLKDFQYEDSKTTGDVAGSLNISRLTLAPSKATLTNSITSDEVEFKLGETSDQVSIFKGTYTAKKRDVNLNEFLLSGGSTAWTGAHKLTAFLYVGGENVADDELTLSNGSWTASDTFTNVTVKAGESVDIEVKAQVEAADAGTIDATKFTLYVWGEDENGNPNQGRADKTTAKVSVVNKGTAEIDAGKAKKTVLLRGSTDAIAEFIVKPSGSSAFDLEDISFTKPANVRCDALKLEGGIDEDLEERTISGAKVCIADGFVENVSKSGITVRVVFDDEPTVDDYNSKNLIEVEVKGLKINGKDVSDTFNKAYAEALLTFTQSGDGKSKTTYKVAEIKGYNSSVKVSDLHFYDKNGNELNTDLTAGEQLEKDSEFTIQNSCSGEIQVMKMTYVVNRGNAYANKTVEISHADYPEYFKTTGGDKLTVYANSKDNCSVDNITIKVKGVSISGAAELGTGKTLQLQAIIDPADAADKTVSWTGNNDAIATVDNNGLVTALSNTGDVTITVTTTDGGFTATKTITVTGNVAP